METHAEKHSNYSSSRCSEVDAYVIWCCCCALPSPASPKSPGIDTNELYRGTAWRVMYSSMDRSGPM